MEDDFNTPFAISLVFDLIKEGNRLLDEENLVAKDARDILVFLKEIEEYLGFILGREDASIPAAVTTLAEQREQHRKEGNFERADALREELQERGWLVEDAPSGWKLKKLVYQKYHGSRNAK